MEEMRIQKYLSEMGVMSRRAAETAVISGRVFINGVRASVGQKIVPEIDEILVDGILISQKERENNKKVYMMMYKPVGVVTTMSDEQGRFCVGDILEQQEFPERVYPVGRLDMYSEGLLLLTNDGETANKLMHPKHEISKIYHATLKGDVKHEIIKKLEEPIEINGRLTTPAKIDVVEQKNGRTKLKIEIFEGRNRQIRRMCENLNLVILKLKRVCVGKLNIGLLKPGEFKLLNHNEIKYLKNILNKTEK